MIKILGANARICFFEYAWNPLLASGQEYDTNVLYQVSFFSRIPRHPKLFELRNKLKKQGIIPFIEHEYSQKDRLFHSYFKVEILENLDEQNK